ncbi:MAG TPA: hypothetical protein VGK29_23895 [Paludibaculum sp.]|jgi:hypothetical protein
MRTAILWLTATLALHAQTTIAPTDEKVGEARGQTIGNYNLVQSWELGYRFHSIGGNQGKYRSDVNYGNGIRLLGSRFSMKSKEGHGGLFDEMTLSTQGLGNDPYEYANLRIAKNRVYRYDMIWRSNEYFNPALAVSGGQHAMDTVHRLQDHDFTLLPQSKVRFFAGFSRSLQQGPALTTTNVFDGVRGDEFALFGNVHRRQNESRFGNEIRAFGMRLNWMQVFEQYREETPLSLEAPSAGANTTDRTRLTSYGATEPYQGTTPSFRLSLFRERGERWAVNGRFTYSSGNRDFAFSEAAIGVNRFGAAQNRQIAVGGDARRPVTTGNLTLSLFPTTNLTITNHTAYHLTKMEGRSTYTEINNSTLDLTTVNFRYLGIRNISNVTDAHFQIRPWLALRGGYQFSDREIKSVEQVIIEGFPGENRSQQSNRLNAGSAGVRLKPLRTMLLAVDGELGRQDRPFYPTSEKNYEGYSARLQWRPGAFALTALARVANNSNTTTLFAYSAKTRQYGADGSWNPRDWFSLDAGYAKLHAGTVTGLGYFLASALVTGQQSVFLSNLHTGHLGVHVSLKERIDLYAGFSLSRDAGDPTRSVGPVPASFAAVQVFPMNFDSPLARLSVKITPKIRWNFGYQYYRYKEDMLAVQNYRAHTGYTSVLWTF